MFHPVKIQLCFALALMLSLPALGKQNTTAPSFSQVYPFHEISTLSRMIDSAGRFDTYGYVVKVYECPPCPKPGLCKPCMKEHIVISEKKVRKDSYGSMSETEMILNTPQSKTFRLLKRYRFSIELQKRASTKKPPTYRSATLLDWKEILAK